MTKRLRHTPAPEHTLDNLPMEPQRVLLTLYCCPFATPTGLDEATHRWRTLRCVSRALRQACATHFRTDHCARCRRLITPHAEYYSLAGGGNERRVINCVSCATRAQFTIRFAGKPLTLERGWDRTYCAKSLQKRMV